MNEYDKLVYLAHLAEQAERYDEMTEHVKKLAELGVELDTNARNLLSVAYKNAVGNRRASWRVIKALGTKQHNKGNRELAVICDEYRQNIEADLERLCGEILGVLENNLIVNPSGDESRVFFCKMQGDYYRYVAEIRHPDDINDPRKKAEAAYGLATAAAKNLPKTNPVRLGLALNQSVFHYEILEEHEKACKMAQEAFDEAIQELDQVAEETYKDSTLIMQLIKDNLMLWTVDDAKKDGDHKEKAEKL